MSRNFNIYLFNKVGNSYKLDENLFKMRPKKILLFLFILCLSSCKVNQLTGKKTFNIMGNKQLFATSFQQYDAFLKENKIIQNTAESESIQAIGKKIAFAAEQYFAFKGYPDYLKDYAWEYNLVDDKLVNAWCMPGGKIVFYTGILPIAGNESGIAAIMGHEVAHALANHGGQRMSLAMAQQGVGILTQSIVKEQPEKKKNAILMAYGIGSSIGVMMPFSRKHESEADKIGLELMAIAGYDVDEAPQLWERMKAQSKGNTPEFLSTHPSEERRIQNLKMWSAEAKALAIQINP